MRKLQSFIAIIVLATGFSAGCSVLGPEALAERAISNAEVAVNRAAADGRERVWQAAKERLDQANDAFDSGDYMMALQHATAAKEITRQDAN